jgi:hypothetical protein
MSTEFPAEDSKTFKYFESQGLVGYLIPRFPVEPGDQQWEFVPLPALADLLAGHGERGNSRS